MTPRTTYYIQKCRLCGAITATRGSWNLLHECTQSPDAARGELDSLGLMNTTLDLTNPTTLHQALERLKFGDHIIANPPFSPAGQPRGTEQDT